MDGFLPRNPIDRCHEVNQLVVDKFFAINNLRTACSSEPRIVHALGLSRGSVRRRELNGTTAPTASDEQAPTGLQDSNSSTAPTGSGDEQPFAEAIGARNG